MRYFKNSIVAGCLIVGVFVLQLISGTIQPAPELIVNLSNKFFHLIEGVLFAVLVFVVIRDVINYRLFRH